MAQLTFTGGHVDDTPSLTLAGLAKVFKSMRWEDLNTFANEIEDLRVNGGKTITAKTFNEWAGE